MICIHHNKDLDGFASGAVVKRKYPDCQLIGWDYKDPIPWEQLPEGQEIIMIDISFPMEAMCELSRRSGGRLTVIDHHISFKRDFDAYLDEEKDRIVYVYEAGIAACEIGWKHFFPDTKVPQAITLLGEYDTWRHFGSERWIHHVLPFQYYMRQTCTAPEDFPEWMFSAISSALEACMIFGRSIVKYQQEQDRLACQRSSFERPLQGLKAVCLNTRAFSSMTMASVYNPEKHDLMVGFEYTGTKWSVSLRSDKPDVDVSLIAKARGGGGHKAAAGFECDSFEEIFAQAI